MSVNELAHFSLSLSLAANWKLRLRRSKRKTVSFYLNAIGALVRKHSSSSSLGSLRLGTLACFSKVCTRAISDSFFDVIHLT